MSTTPRLQGFPDGFRIPFFAHRRVDPDDAAKTFIIAAVEKQITGTGFAGHIDTARLGLREGTQLAGRGDMKHVDSCPGPLSQDGRAGDRLDRHDLGPGSDVMKRGVQPGGFEFGLPPGHDRSRFRMQRDAQPGCGDQLESFKHRSRRGRRQVAERVAHEAFERVGTRFDKPGNLIDVVFCKKPVETEIHAGLPGAFLLLPEFGDRARWRVGVGHLEHRGHPAHCRSLRACAPVFLVGVTRLAEMHMHVDAAGDEVMAGHIDHLGSLSQCSRGANGGDQLSGDRDVGSFASVFMNDGAAFENEIRHGSP
jgi:hypothetical protein